MENRDTLLKKFCNCGETNGNHFLNCNCFIGLDLAKEARSSLKVEILEAGNKLKLQSTGAGLMWKIYENGISDYQSIIKSA